MKEDELTKDAWELINRVVEKVEFPSYVSVSKNDDGTVSFHLVLSSESCGFASLYYKPSIGFIKEILKLEKSAEKAVGKKLANTFNTAAAECYAYGVLKNFPFEFEETFNGFYDLGWILLTQARTYAIKKSTGHNSEFTEKKNEEAESVLNEYLNERSKRTKERLLEESKKYEASSKPVKHLISHFYAECLVDWKKAKNFYKKNKIYDKWEQMISLAFPKLPKDLISRLDNSDPYISMPSAIALEHAARICGIEDSSVGIRTLQQYLNKSRQWIAENGEEAKETELEKYRWRIFHEVVIFCRVCDSLGKEPTFENFSYIHQVVGEDIKDTAMKKIKEYSENNEKA